MLTGIDVSHHQFPGDMNWKVLRAGVSFCIARATYGTKPDRYFFRHIQAARAEGVKVGGYHFFRQGQAARPQLEAFTAQLATAGIGPGDIIPAIDIEDNHKFDGAPEHAKAALAEEICDALVRQFGDCMVYGSQRDWSLFGKPDWWLRRPLWVAHYTAAPKPATPGDLPWTIWQRAGDAHLTGYPGELDVSICPALPLIQPFAGFEDTQPGNVC